MASDWRTTREQFPVLRNWVYLNTATFGPVPRCALDAMDAHARRRDEQACLDFLDWFDDADQVRALAARMIGVGPEDIAFVPNTGAALGWLIHGIDWRPGDRVVALEDEFPNNSYFGHWLAGRGVEFVEVPLPGGEFSLDRLCAAVTDRTRLALVSSVNYSTGLRPPLDQIGRLLRSRGVLFYVDGTQSLGALRIDVASIQADMFVAHGYKWLLCPAGIGIACVRPEVREWLQPSVLSWRSHKDWRRVDALHHGPPELPSGAQKYEGGLQNFPGIYAMGAVLGMMLDLGLEQIESRVQSHAAHARDVLRAHGGELAADRLPYYDSPVVAAKFPGRDVSALAGQLRDARIAVAARHGCLRVSPHFFNDEGDLDRLDRALSRAGS